MRPNAGHQRSLLLSYSNLEDQLPVGLGVRFGGKNFSDSKLDFFEFFDRNH